MNSREMLAAVEGIVIKNEATVTDRELQRVLASATLEALAICRVWDEHFGEPGWGSVSYIQGELHYAEQAAVALRALLREKDTKEETWK